MLPDDDEPAIRQLMAQYQPTAPDYLATRIIARATALPQKQGLAGFMIRAFSEWNYALPMKSAVLAAFVVLGMFSAQLTQSQSIDPNAVLLADPNWTEEL